MNTSRNPCGEIADSCPNRHCERSEAIHSSTARKNGLVRGACHRARIRATRWLAMTMLSNIAKSCVAGALPPRGPCACPRLDLNDRTIWYSGANVADLRAPFRGKRASPRGSNRHFQHVELSESEKVSGIGDQAIDQAADRRHRARIDRPDDRDVRAVDDDGRPGKPSAG